MMDYREIMFRLLSSVLIGGLVGLDRNLRGKPTGIKTLGLVALGASLMTMTSQDFALAPAKYDSAAVSRVVQGIITGIGFLGAGVIVHEEPRSRVRGLTTAASIWATAALGIVCGLGRWPIALMALAIVGLLFVIAQPLERRLHERWMNEPAGKTDRGSGDDE